MFEHPWICISKLDQDFIDAFATHQVERRRVGKRRAAKNDQTFLKSEDSIVAGYRGELAVARYLGLSFDQTIGAENSSLGDLDYGIEVKATDNPVGNLFCSEKTLTDYLKRSINTPVVLAKLDAWPWVEIPGWIMAKDISKHPFERTHARHNRGYLVPVGKLKLINELKNAFQTKIFEA